MEERQITSVQMFIRSDEDQKENSPAPPKMFILKPHSDPNIPILNLQLLLEIKVRQICEHVVQNLYFSGFMGNTLFYSGIVTYVFTVVCTINYA